MSFTPIRVHTYNVDTESHELHALKIQDNFNLIAEELSALSRSYNQYTSPTNPNSGNIAVSGSDYSLYVKLDGTTPLTGTWDVGVQAIENLAMLRVKDGAMFVSTSSWFPTDHRIHIGECEIYNTSAGTTINNNQKRLTLDGKMRIDAPVADDAFVIHSGYYDYFKVSTDGGGAVYLGGGSTTFAVEAVGLFHSTISTNRSDSFVVKDTSQNNYMSFITTSGFETLTFGSIDVNQDYLFLGTGDVSFGGQGYFDGKITSNTEVNAPILSNDSGVIISSDTTFPNLHEINIGSYFTAKANGTDFILTNGSGVIEVNGTGYVIFEPKITCNSQVEFNDFAIFGNTNLYNLSNAFYINNSTYLLQLSGKISLDIPNSTTAFVAGESADPSITIDTTNNKIYLSKYTTIGGPTNRTRFEADGTMVAEGSATCFRDEQSPLLGKSIESPSSKIEQNLAEGALGFEWGCRLTDYVVMSPQLNHDRKLGTTVNVHVHWWQTENYVPNWLIEYRWQRQGYPKVTSWTRAGGFYTIFTYDFSGGMNQITTFGDITPPANDGVSDILQVRLLRDVINESTLFSGSDVLSSTTVYATSLDCHIEIDMLGSHTQYSK